MKYRNKSGRSGIDEVEYDADQGVIEVTFNDGSKYSYNKEDNGDYTISRMAAMADNGEYLNRMINHEKPSYSGQSSAPKGDVRSLRKSDEVSMRAIHNKFLYRGKQSLKQMVREALIKKTGKTG